MKITPPQDISGSSFTRAGAALYHDSTGLMVSAGVDVPRFDWDPVTLNCRGLMVEAAATNRVWPSEDWSAESMVYPFTSVTIDAIAAPDGTITGNYLFDPNTAAPALVEKNTGWSVAIGDTVTCSIYIKQDTRTSGTSYGSAGSTFNCYVTGDTETNSTLTWGDDGVPTLSTVGGTATATIEEDYDGWWRWSLTITAGVAGAVYFRIWPAKRSGVDHTATGGVYVWGRQVESGSAATSYIKTVSGTVTRAADVVGGSLVTNVPEADHAEYDAGTAYALDDYVIVSSAHRIYRSLQAGNTGHDPESEVDPDNPVWWVDAGATNRWRLFDQVVNNPCAMAEVINVSLQLVGRVNRVYLLALDAASVDVRLRNSSGTEVFNEHYSLINSGGIDSWYDWLFAPIVRQPALRVIDIPPYLNARLDIAVRAPDGTAYCGEIVTGFARDLGGTQYGARVGIQDHSIKSTDDFGISSFTERTFARTSIYSLLVDRDAVTEVDRLLSEYRATPIIYDGSDDDEITILYGVFRDFYTVLAYAKQCICNLELEGLT